jgi:hypothetical protein
MDFLRYMGSAWLTLAELERRGGRFEGVITEVSEQSLRNPFTGVFESRAVIHFDCGTTTVPSRAMGKTLVGLYGGDTDAWVGRRIVVFRRAVERKSKATGEMVTRYERAVIACDPRFTKTAPPADYDDSPEALAYHDDQQEEG